MFHNILEHPKTTLLGLAMIIGTGVSTLYPQYADLTKTILVLIGAGGLAVAKDPGKI